MKIKLPKPVNETQEAFAELCAKGGGPKGGPARTKVQALLRESGQELNKYAEAEIAHSLRVLSSADPWKVCFAMGLCWGHLARLSDDFMEAAVAYLETGDGKALHGACLHNNERGPDVIESSLIGGYSIFSKLTMPPTLPDTIAGMRSVQDRWLGRVLAKDRPRYIGSWNGTAVFMIALFAQPSLGDQLKEAGVMLPPGGPIHAALSLLHLAGVTSRRPEGSELDDASFEAGAIFANTALMAEIRKGRDDWDMLDVHSGLYMLGTRDPASRNFFR